MRISKSQIIAIILIVILVPIGFYTKLYSGAGSVWVNNKLGGVLYEIFWCLFFYSLLPKAKPAILAIWILIITSILEFVQLLNSELLNVIRSNTIGQTIIGNSFTWSDFPYYFIGSFMGFLILSGLNRLK